MQLEYVFRDFSEKFAIHLEITVTEYFSGNRIKDISNI